MVVPLVTSRQITIGVTVGYFLVIFMILLIIDHYLKRYEYFRNRLALRIVIAIILYYPIFAILFYTISPSEVDHWLHEILNVPYPWQT